MLPSAPGAAVMIKSLPETVAARAGVLFAGQLTALIWFAMDWRIDAAVVCVRVSEAEPSELETASGPEMPGLSVMKISLPKAPPVVAEQLGSEALICPAMFAAISALPSEPSTHEYVDEPIVTEWL